MAATITELPSSRKRAPSKRGNKKAVLAYLISRPGVPTTNTQISKKLKLTAKQVASTMQNLVNDLESGVHRTGSGIYVFNGPAEAGIYHKIGETRDGVWIFEDNSGEIVMLRPVE